MIRTLAPTTRACAAVALVALALGAGCLGAVGTPTNPTDAALNSSADSPPTVSVTGTGTVTAAPDLAAVSLEVAATEETADEARAAVANASADVRDALAEAGVEDDQIQTSGYSIQPMYDEREGRDRAQPTSYRAVHAYTVEVAPDDAGTVVDAAVGAGATGVSVTFTLAEETRESLRADAITAAVDDARADADAVAAAAGTPVTDLRSASMQRVGVPYAGDGVAEDAAAGTEFDPGPVTVRASVDVVYELESEE